MGVCLCFKQVFKHMKKNWGLGFLGLFSIYGVMGIISQEWIQAAWLLWVIWFWYLLPEKKVEEKPETGKALERSTNEKVGKNNKSNNFKATGIMR